MSRPKLPGLAIFLFSVFLGQAHAVDNPAADAAAPSTEKKTIRILGIGNSFLKNATGPLRGVVAAAGHDLVLCQAAPGGCTLERHYQMAQLNEADPQAPQGKPYDYDGRKMSLKEVLTADRWDYVTIQQSSPNSFKIETYRPHAQNLCDYIKRYAPDAEIMFHQTWAWREDSRRGGGFNEQFGQREMYQALTRAYHTVAAEVGIRKIIPVGDAFRLAGESPDWTFQKDPDFDYDAPTYPDLPREKNSLHDGYSWTVADDGATKTFRLDGSHANAAGGYLAACVWFEFFYGDDVRKLKTNPGFLGERAASLREIAHRVVTGGARPAAWPADFNGS